MSPEADITHPPSHRHQSERYKHKNEEKAMLQCLCPGKRNVRKEKGERVLCKRCGCEKERNRYAKKKKERKKSQVRKRKIWVKCEERFDRIFWHPRVSHPASGSRISPPTSQHPPTTPIPFLPFPLQPPTPPNHQNHASKAHAPNPGASPPHRIVPFSCPRWMISPTRPIPPGGS